MYLQVHTHILVYSVRGEQTYSHIKFRLLFVAESVEGARKIQYTTILTIVLAVSLLHALGLRIVSLRVGRTVLRVTSSPCFVCVYIYTEIFPIAGRGKIIVSVQFFSIFRAENVVGRKSEIKMKEWG